MSQNKEDQETNKSLENVESALTGAEQFFEKNVKSVTICAIAVLAVIVIIAVVNNFYLKPLKAEAQKEIFNAQYYFEADSFRLALEGDGVNAGFAQIADDYSSTPAGKLANYYAGVCNMRLGNFDEAIRYFKVFSCDDETLNTFAEGLIGDAECELGNSKAAVAAYKKAASNKNEVASPIFLFKLGKLYLREGQKSEAVAAFKQIKDEYPTNQITRDVEKYINAAN
ncbi:MAG: tetratricopeptide repeat protein [Marinilabiliaceae bacterium]|nr:tetratricopeptide repeat protein [Marinilabiliaceae bacterium]